ncbi:MAG: hypothetical protein Q7U92_00215 [Bradyrhizobium sp.]|nr:hypothetical protein [Bradyrhizobium sp.]
MNGHHFAICAKSAQQTANPDHPTHQPCQPALHARRMGKIIIISFRSARLPRRLLKDGWWLESPPARRAVIAFPQRDAPKPKHRGRHLTLVTSGK